MGHWVLWVCVSVGSLLLTEYSGHESQDAFKNLVCVFSGTPPWLLDGTVLFDNETKHHVLSKAEGERIFKT